MTSTQKSLTTYFAKRDASAPAAMSAPAATATTLSNETIALSEGQERALLLFKQKLNLFITGPGGSGKTKLIECIKEYSAKNRKRCQVCALTGCAAHLLPKACAATTIHSWSGIGLCKGPVHEIIASTLRWRGNRTRWTDVDILVVDEVSMMSLKIFDVLDKLGRAARKMPDVPFGGIQVVFLGDFYQLPPVPDRDRKEPSTGQFCFECPTWTEVFPPTNVVQLTTVFRQCDPAYRNVLLEIREGKLSEANREMLHAHYLRTRVIAAPIRPGLVSDHCTKLYPMRGQARDYNDLMFSKIDEPSQSFSLRVKTDLKLYNNQPIKEAMLRKCVAISEGAKKYEINRMAEAANYLDVLELKKGAFVMSLVNNHQVGIYNGSQGIVVDFVGSGDNVEPVVKFFNGVTMQMSYVLVQSYEHQCIGIAQIPLCLAWARTIHKSQGATLDMAEVDVGFGIFEYGQTYVALSRVKSLDGLRLSGFNPQRIRVDPKVQQFYERMNVVEDVVDEDEDDGDDEDEDDDDEDVDCLGCDNTGTAYICDGVYGPCLDCNSADPRAYHEDEDEDEDDEDDT